MNAEQWIDEVRRAVTLLGEVHAQHVQSARLIVALHPMAANDGTPVTINDGRPKIISFTVETSG